MALSRTIHLSGNRKRNSRMVKDGVNEYDGKALCFYCSVFGLCRTNTAKQHAGRCKKQTNKTDMEVNLY